VLVHSEDLAPVVGLRVQVVILAQVNQSLGGHLRHDNSVRGDSGEYLKIFSEARATKSDTRVQEVLSNALVSAEDSGDLSHEPLKLSDFFGEVKNGYLLDVGATLLAQSSNGVDRRHSLSQERIRGAMGNNSELMCGRNM